MDQIKLHRKYLPLFTSDDNYYVMTGGRGSGKSFALSAFALTLISREEGHRIAVYRATMVSVEDSIMKDMKDMVQMLPDVNDFDVQHGKIIHKKTKSEIFFKGIQTNKLSNTAYLKGLSNCTVFILDEAEELDDVAKWRKIDDTFRTTKKQIRMILSLNPALRTHWIYDYFITDNGWSESRWDIPEDPNMPVRCLSDGCGSTNNITFIHSTYLDNYDNLAPHKAKQWDEYRFKDPEYFKNGILGGWKLKADGVVYDNWKCEEGVTEWREYDKAIGCLDFGFDHPTAMNVISLDSEGSRIYTRCVLYKRAMTSADMIKFLKDEGLNRLRWICDGARPEIIEDMVRAGIKAERADKSPGTKDDGIALLQNLEIYVDPHKLDDSHVYRQPLVVELQNYTWDDRKEDEKTVKKYDDALDALRYGVYYLIGKKYTSTKQREAFY